MQMYIIFFLECHYFLDIQYTRYVKTDKSSQTLSIFGKYFCTGVGWGIMKCGMIVKDF